MRAWRSVRYRPTGPRKSARVCKPDGHRVIDAERLDLLRVADVAADDDALLALIELVAALGIVQEVREVREQTEVGVDAEQLRALRRPAPDAIPRARETVALRAAAIGAIHVAEASDLTAVYGALRNLVGRVPSIAVRHA